MIKYALVCAHEHPFEGWFGSSADYDGQSARGLVACPVCGANEVRKQIMAPAVSGTKAHGSAVEPDPRMRSMMMEAMRRVRSHVTENFDYVGDRFATEARAIHEGASEDRGIYGEASPKEVRALIDDGVQVSPLPPEPPKKSQLN
ncbi:MAG TPA: DUF1178 family protein [Caulobacteraceae bacterium]|nr:DUF1178 family protein [Caulobacteraceae bacterium]